MNTSLRKAIDQHCKDCIYDPQPGNGTWRKQVEDCTSPNCALYPVRPVTIQKRELKVENSAGGVAPCQDTKIPLIELSGGENSQIGRISECRGSSHEY